VSDHGRVAVLSMRNFGSATPVMLKAVAEIVAAEAEAENLTTVFIPHHAPEGVGGDIKLANQVAAVFEASRFSIVDPIPLAAELKAITSEAEWVVTMRYHQLVFALSQGIPAVGISVNPYTHAKLCGAFEQMKLDPIVTSLEQAPERLSVLLGLAKSRRSEFIAAAREFSEREIAASFAPYQYVADLMK
jgi:polysaccharide pyruvyl transferase WcaK-like protein